MTEIGKNSYEIILPVEHIYFDKKKIYNLTEWNLKLTVNVKLIQWQFKPVKFIS